MFGGNFLTEHLDDKAKSRADAKRMKSRLHLVMSDAGDTSFARDLKQDTPEATVIFRPYNKDDRRWQDIPNMTAEQIWDIHRNYAVDGLGVQVWNEPGYSPALMTLAVQVARLARQDGKQVALPSPGVGNFGESDVSQGRLDALLFELYADKRVMGSANPPNLLAVHEYAQESTLSEQPYRIGRVKWMLDRAASILKAPIDPMRVAVLEYGRDVAGDALKDGWKVKFNGDEQKFFDFMTPGELYYLLLGLLGSAVYCQGKTWPSFDWQKADLLIGLMADWNDAHPAKAAQPYAPGTSPHSKRVNLDGIRLRTAPGLQASILRPLNRGEVVTVFDAPVESADAYQWGRVTTTRNEKGWSALVYQGHPSFVDFSTPQPPTLPILEFVLHLPVTPPGRITQHFGENLTGIPNFYTKWGLPAHEGDDFAGAMGDPIFAAADGIVKAINIPGQGGVVLNHAYGIHVKLLHTDTSGQQWETDYCHLSAVVSGLVVGGHVTTGQHIAMMGKTGDANNQVHLHFMLRRSGNSAAGINQRLANGSFALYKNDIVNPEPYFVS